MTDADLDVLVDEYVLGLLDDAEREEIERHLAAEPLLREAVERSRGRFLELDLAAPPVVAPEALWTRVAARIGAPDPESRPLDARPAAGASVIALPANRSAPPRSGLWGALGAGAAAAAGLVIGAIVGAQALRPEPVVLTVLVNAAGAPLAVVEDYGDAQARVRFVAEVEVPEGRQMQVWTLPSPETGPVSLGLLEGPFGQLLRGPDLPPPAAGQLYEITLEQLGGSPTGRPTGPIVAKGLAAAQDA